MNNSRVQYVYRLCVFIGAVVLVLGLMTTIAQAITPNKGLTLADIRNSEESYAVGEIMCKISGTEINVLLVFTQGIESKVVVINDGGRVDAITVTKNFSDIPCHRVMIITETP